MMEVHVVLNGIGHGEIRMRGIKLGLLMIAGWLSATAYAEPVENGKVLSGDRGVIESGGLEREKARNAEADARRQLEISRIEAAGSARSAGPDNARGRAEQEARAAVLEAEQARVKAERAAAARAAAEREEKSRAESQLKASRTKQSSRPARDLGVESEEEGAVSRIEAPGRMSTPQDKR